jgi:integrase/recombinase XerD
MPKLALLNSKTALSLLADDYISSCIGRGLAPRTIDKSYRYALYAVFLPWCEGEGIDDLALLDQRAIDRFSASLIAHRKEDGQPLSKYTIHAWVRPVRQLLKWAASVGEDVQARPQLPRTEKPVHETISREDIDRMELSLPTERDRLIIRLFADCGLRLEELTTLTSADIRRTGRHAFLRVLGKRDRVREIPIMPGLLRRLERHIASRAREHTSDRIFLSNRRSRHGDYGPLTNDGVYKVVRDAAARCRIDRRIHPHLFRHSWMTEMLRSGMNPIQLSLIAGASPDVIARCYTHLTKDDAYEAMARVFAQSRT